MLCVMVLAEKGQMVVNQNGLYLVQWHDFKMPFFLTLALFWFKNGQYLLENFVYIAGVGIMISCLFHVVSSLWVYGQHFAF